MGRSAAEGRRIRPGRGMGGGWGGGQTGSLDYAECYCTLLAGVMQERSLYTENNEGWSGPSHDYFWHCHTRFSFHSAAQNKLR